MSETVNVFLPMRAGSERIPKKNTESFAGIDGGLCSVKLEQLLKGPVRQIGSSIRRVLSDKSAQASEALGAYIL